MKIREFTEKLLLYHDGSHLIPYSFTKDFYSYAKLAAWLRTPLCDRFSNPISSGKGHLIKNKQAAISHARRSKIPYIQSKCCLEGGNVFLFTDAREEKKAIIGNNSVVMSFLALTEQKAFNHPEFEKHAKELEPSPISDFFLSKAKNFLLSERGFSKISTQSEDVATDPTSCYRRTSSELIVHAKRIRAQWTYTQSIIAKELGIALENIAWIEQEEFHIDLTLTVVEDCVFVDDGKKTLELIERELSFDLLDKKVQLQEYQKQAARLAPYSSRLNEQNRSEFARIGLRMVPVAGRFEAAHPSFPDLPTINFFNALLLPTAKKRERLYAVAPCPYPYFYRNFFEVLRQSIPSGILLRPLSVHLIKPVEKRTRDFIGRGLSTKGGGGLRCMTNTAPQTSVFSELPSTCPPTLLPLWSWSQLAIESLKKETISEILTNLDLLIDPILLQQSNREPSLL